MTHASLLAWLTFVAAAVAAVGGIAGPLIAYHASLRRIEADREAASARQREEGVNRLVEQATGANDRLSQFAVAQLDYLLGSGRLTGEQTAAVRHAIAAVTDPLTATLGNAAPLEEDDLEERGLHG